ncbi:hypothetical protein [Kitasatospora sp. A2-31]|uniref:hypothetical protein n=1 Tax=Kitasatospora sp. A2-31 TaxID=2916414 RepID=UPI001EE923E7|nr:hypothetical protein [Kitasatospora sp. A2-31]MCG6492933.1 hypothetical protein [Kitasatospora sp. A2-31]
MSAKTTGPELLLELPGVDACTVVGTAEITADGTGARTNAVVKSGVPVRVKLPAEVGYSVRGRLTSGERLHGYAEADGRSVWTPLPLTVLPRLRPPAVPGGRRFPGTPWAAGWTWDVEVGEFVPGFQPIAQQHATGTLLTGGPGKSTNLIQVSPTGGPASFVLLPDETPLWVTGDRLQPEPGRAATLLDCLRRGDLSGAGAAAAEALDGGDSIGAWSRPVLLDLALGYYLLDTYDDRLASWAKQLVDCYEWSADAQVVRAGALLRSHGDHDEEIAERLEAAVACGLPVITRGMQLLNDNLDLISEADAGARQTVLSYAIGSQTGTVLTTFWGEFSDSPQSTPVLGERPWHAVPLAEEVDPAPWSCPIAGSVGDLLELLSLWSRQPASHPVLVGLHSQLEDCLKLASRLSLAGTAREVTRLSALLGESLQQAERHVFAWAAGLAVAQTTMDRSTASALRNEPGQSAYQQVGAALEGARGRLRMHVPTVDRAESVEHALASAVGDTNTFAANLAADVLGAVTALRRADLAAGGHERPSAAPRAAVSAGTAWVVGLHARDGRQTGTG